MNQIETKIAEFLKKRIAGTLSDEEHKYLVDKAGHFTKIQLNSVILEGQEDGLREVARREKASRGEWPSHWTVVSGFVIATLSLIFAAIGSWPVIRPWFPAFQSAPTSQGASQPADKPSPPAGAPYDASKENQTQSDTVKLAP